MARHAIVVPVFMFCIPRNRADACCRSDGSERSACRPLRETCHPNTRASKSGRIGGHTRHMAARAHNTPWHLDTAGVGHACTQGVIPLSSTSTALPGRDRGGRLSEHQDQRLTQAGWNWERIGTDASVGGFCI